jgi:hypothetical protein
MTPAEVRAIMATQSSREARLAAADDVIDNGGPPEAMLAAGREARPALPRARGIAKLARGRAMIRYEHPLNERVRTLMRLEGLYARSLFFTRRDDARGAPTPRCSHCSRSPTSRRAPI